MVVRPLLGMSTVAVLAAGCGGSGTPSIAERTATNRAPAATVAAATTATAPTITSSASPRARGEVRSGPVVYVSDGDTIGVRLAGVVTRIRLLGIDAPESKDPDLPPQCYSKRAAALLTALAPRGSTVTVVTDPTQDRIDKFGRLLAYVFPTGRPRTLNEAMVRQGGAVVYVYRSNRPPRRLAELRAAEREARGAGRGLWGACPARR